MTVLITLTTVGIDAGPFSLYSNTDGYSTAFATGISAAALIAGYTSTTVPPGTTTIRVKSTGACTNYIDIPVAIAPTTSTTTTMDPCACEPALGLYVTVCNNSAGTTIDNIYPFFGSIFIWQTDPPVGPGQIIKGTSTGYSGTLSIDVSGGAGSRCLKVYVNGLQVDAIPMLISNTTYTTSTLSFDSTDCVQFVLTDDSTCI